MRRLRPGNRSTNDNDDMTTFLQRHAGRLRSKTRLGNTQNGPWWLHLRRLFVSVAAMAITYRDAGVDIDAGDGLVERIKPLAARLRTKHVLADVGGFAGLCRIPAG